MPSETVPPVMTDLSQLGEDDHWAWTCHICKLATQGGRAGLAAHKRVVHGIPGGGNDGTNQLAGDG